MSVLEEKAEELMKAAGRGVLRGLLKIWDYAKKETAFTGKRSMQRLIKKYPNQGIHTEKELSKDDADKIIKELKKFKIDYALNKIEDTKQAGEFHYELTVVGGNKSIVDDLKDKYGIDKEKNNEDIKPVKKNLVKNLKNKTQKAKSLNSERQAPVKHRDIGAR